MGTKTKIKTEAATFVPKNREEVVEAIGEIGRRQRERARIEAAMNDKISKIKETHEEEAKPHGDEIRRLSKGIQLWCESHRDELTQGGKFKTVKLSSGDVLWRMRPPKVIVKAAEKIIEILKDLGLLQFIRTKEEINKEAILAAKTLATPRGKEEPSAEVVQAAKTMTILEGIKGITIEKGEDFVIVPFETTLEEIV